MIHARKDYDRIHRKITALEAHERTTHPKSETTAIQPKDEFKDFRS